MSERHNDKALDDALGAQFDAWRSGDQAELGLLNEEILRLLASGNRTQPPLLASDKIDLLGRQAIAFRTGDQAELGETNTQLEAIIAGRTAGRQHVN